MVGLPGFEPGTSRLSGARSDQLSYRPKASLGNHGPSALRRAVGSPSPKNPAPEPGRPKPAGPRTRGRARPRAWATPSSEGRLPARCDSYILNRVWTARDGPMTSKYRAASSWSVGRAILRSRKHVRALAPLSIPSGAEKTCLTYSLERR